MPGYCNGVTDYGSARRHSEENPSNSRPSHDQSPPMTSQTEVMSIPHTGAQSHPPMDVGITQGNANAQTIQSYGNSAAGNQQLATGSSVNVVDNKGPTQLGERSTVIYNITNHSHCSHQPPHHQSNAPTHCAPCLHYHHNDHQPLAEHNGQHQEAQHRHLLPSQNPLPQLLPSGQTELPAARQTEQDETNTQRVSRTPETRQVPDDEVTDNVTIIDTEGRRLMPGDVVKCSRGFAIYTGNQCIVWCEGTGQVVESRTLDMTQTFWKLRIISGDCCVFPPEERVQRTESRVGTRFTEGDGWLHGLDGFDFTFWVLTGLGVNQAWNRGFRLR